MVNKIKIKNYGCLNQFEATLNQTNVFYGPDSSGKSSILESIYHASNPHTQLTQTLSDFVAATENFAAVELTQDNKQLKVLIYPHKTTYFINEKIVDPQTILDFNHVFFMKLDPENFFSSATQQKWLFDKLCKKFPTCQTSLLTLTNQIKNLLEELKSPACTPIQRQKNFKELELIRQTCRTWFAKTEKMLEQTETLFNKFHHELFAHDPTIKITPKPWTQLHNLKENHEEAFIEGFEIALEDPFKMIALFVGLGIDFQATTNFLEAFSLRKKIVYLLLLDLAIINLCKLPHKNEVVILVDNFDFLNHTIQNYFLNSASQLGQVLITKETTITPLKIPHELENTTTIFHAPFQN